jgi:hypothetical protein
LISGKCNASHSYGYMGKVRFAREQAYSLLILSIFIAGCGKTVMSSTIIDKINEENLGVLACHYFSFRDEKSQEVRLLLYSLLTQLVRSLVREIPQQSGQFYLPRAFRDLYRKYQPASQPKIEHLIATLRDVSAESKQTYIVIDAVDECSSREGRENVIKILAALRAQSNMHILLTSREENDIKDTINNVLGEKCNRVSIQNKRVNDDIRTHLRTRMAVDSVFKSWQPGLQERVVDHLTENADGVFRWVKCQLDTLRKLRERTTEEDIDKALRELPKDLDETYSRMLLEIDNSRFADEARAVLKWLAISKRPLKLGEAAEAAIFCLTSGPNGDSVSVNLNKRFSNLLGIRAVLSGLVTVPGLDDQPSSKDEGTDDNHDRILSFAHFSVKEYLECHRVEPKEFRLLESDAHWFVLQSCLAYIHHYDTEISEEVDSGQRPLLLYACKYWPHHAVVLCCDTDQRIRKTPTKRLKEILTKLNGPTLTFSMRVALDTKNNPSREVSAAILKSLLSLKSLASVLRQWFRGSKSEYSFTERAFDFESDLAIHSASSEGEKELVTLLLDGGADIEKKVHGGCTPLARAIGNGHEAVIKLLLVKGAEVDYEYIPYVSDLYPDPSY